MDTNDTKIVSYQVSNVDEQLAYNEQNGCAVQISRPGSCAAVSCSLSKFNLCEESRRGRLRRRLGWFASFILNIPSLAFITIGLGIVLFISTPVALIWWGLEKWDARSLAHKTGTA